MAAGVFRGFVTGIAVATTGVGIFLLMQSPQLAPAPKTAAVEVPAGSDFESAREDTEPKLPLQPDTAPQPGPAPQIDSVDSSEDPVDEAETLPAARPQTGTAEAALTPPAVDGSATQSTTTPQPQVTTEALRPTPPSEETKADDDGKISTDPAQPAAPVVTEETAFPTAQKAEETVDVTPKAEANTPPAPSPRTTPLPTVTDDASDVSPVQDRPKIGTPVGTFTDRDASAVDREKAETVENPLRPIEANAAPFDNPEGKPLMSVILLDDEDGIIGPDALTAFPYKLSIAVDPMSANAQDRMALYRDAGFDVMAAINMPEGATASDAETMMRAALDRVPGAVAVMEGDQTGLQSDRVISDQVTAILADSGHGLVMFPKGLNTAQKLATQEGVPAATLFRDFDAKDQNATIIRRFLDQAAFKARQEEKGVIMLGRMRPDTISALLLWGLQDRASSVALAPISALLLGLEN